MLGEAASFSYQLGMNELQKHPTESHELASNFVLDARQTFIGSEMHHDWILNIDQTLLLFSLHGKQSLDSHGTCIDNRTSTGAKRHVTLAVMVTASGRMLPLFLIFKGRPGS